MNDNCHRISHLELAADRRIAARVSRFSPNPATLEVQVSLPDKMELLRPPIVLVFVLIAGGNACGREVQRASITPQSGANGTGLPRQDSQAHWNGKVPDLSESECKEVLESSEEHPAFQRSGSWYEVYASFNIKCFHSSKRLAHAEAARQMAESGVRKFPMSSTLAMYRAYAEELLGNYSRAVELYEQAGAIAKNNLAENPEHPNAYRDRAALEQLDRLISRARRQAN